MTFVLLLFIEVAILCSADLLLNCIAETIQVIEGSKYCSRGHRVGFHCFK